MSRTEPGHRRVSTASSGQKHFRGLRVEEVGEGAWRWPPAKTSSGSL